MPFLIRYAEKQWQRIAPTGDTLPLTFTFTTFPYMPDGAYLPSTTSVQFTLKSSAPLWQVSRDLGLDLPERGLHIDSITTTGTAVQSYYELQYTVTDVEKASQFYSFDLLSSTGEWLPRGVLGMHGHQNATENGDVLIANGGFEASNEPPAQLMLLIRDPFENITLMETLIDLK